MLGNILALFISIGIVTEVYNVGTSGSQLILLAKKSKSGLLAARARLL